MKCDRALLSSYLDNSLDAPDRQAFERHVVDCAECASALEAYRRLRFDLRDQAPRRAPARLRANVESRMHARRRREQLRLFPVVLGAPLALVGLLAGAALLTPTTAPPPQLAVTATSPAPGASRVDQDGAVELWFDRELMPGTANVTVTVDPPLPVRIHVEGNALRIEPDGSFEPGQTYTVAVESVTDIDGRRLREPAVVSFVTRDEVLASRSPELGSPRGELAEGTTLATEPAPSQGALSAAPAALTSAPSVVSAARVETAGLTAQTRKWPTSRVSSRLTAVEPSVASPSVVEALGAQSAPSQTVKILEQAFQGGVMIKLGGSFQTLVLQRARGEWQSYADLTTTSADSSSETSLPPPPGALAPSGAFGALWQHSASLRSTLGWAVYEPRLSSGLVQQREQGMAITLGRMTYLVRSDGTWSVVPSGRPSAD